MKSYVYKVTDRPNDRNGNPRGLVTVYRLDVNNDGTIDVVNVAHNVSIGYRTYTQAVCEELRDRGEIPEGHTHGNCWRLRTDGIANIQGV